MEKRIKKNTVFGSMLIFLIMLAAQTLETMCLRLDESFFEENFLNKLLGIAVIFCVLHRRKWKLSEIGFSENGFLKSVFIGLALAVCTFSAAYAIEIIMLKGQGHQVSVGFFSVAFSLVGEAEIKTGLGCVLMCIFFNIINVVAEEGVFRGLIFKIVSTEHTEKTAILFQSLLFGVWHIVTPLRNLTDGDLEIAQFAVLSIGYIVLAGFMGIKWSLLYKMTGSLYAGMTDHFFNNCIASNLLHVVTESGIDEMMTVRIITAQMLSFAIVLFAFYKRKNKTSFEAEKQTEK